MAGVHVIAHPLVQHKLSIVRDEATGPKEFRELVEEIAMLMAYEVTRDLPLAEIRVRTPIAEARGWTLSGRKIGVVAILRAGLGMVPGILRLIPAAKVGHIGIYREPETLRPVEYYWKLPADVHERELILVDPMIATGGSAAAAIRLIRSRGGRQVRLMGLIAAPEGIAAVQAAAEDVDIYVASVDERLNEHGYIVPGLGDAGDRLFGTR